MARTTKKKVAKKKRAPAKIKLVNACVEIRRGSVLFGDVKNGKFYPSAWSKTSYTPQELRDIADVIENG